MVLLSTQGAAARLGVTVGRVQQLIWEGKLPADKVGRDYVIQESDLRLVADRKRGRPPKAKAKTVSKAANTRRGKK